MTKRFVYHRTKKNLLPNSINARLITNTTINSATLKRARNGASDVPGPFQLGRIKGTNVAIHYSSLIGFALVGWFLADSVFPAFYPGWSSLNYWLISTISAISLLLSALIHELAHTAVAKSRQYQVSQITLFIFGGITHIENRNVSTRDEILITLAGPFTSLCIAIPLIFFLAYFNDSSGNTAMGAILAFTGIANGFIAIVNLIPGAPLDGGRIIRSVISHSTNSMVGANNIVVRLGQIAGWAFVGFGLFQLFHSSYISGLWLTFFGWFVVLSAAHQWKSKNTEHDLGPISVSQIMYRWPKAASPNSSVQDLFHDFFAETTVTSVAVVENDSLEGVVELADIIQIPTDKWDTTPVNSLMKSLSPMTIHPDESTLSALNLLAHNEWTQLFVTQDRRLVGIIRSQDILRYLDFKGQIQQTRTGK